MRISDWSSDVCSSDLSLRAEWWRRTESNPAPRSRQPRGFVGSATRATSPAKPGGGGGRNRTDDLMLAKHALSQLSYAPIGQACGGQSSSWRAAHGGAALMVGQGRLELPTSRLSSARSNQLSHWPD